MAKNNKRRGFTLVELIVVLVILAILAALLIPALTGYIDKAKKNQVIAETRMLTQAAQTELSSLYATDEFAAQNAYSSFTVASRDGSALPLMVSDKQLLTSLEERYDEIVNLSEVPSLKSGGKGYAVFQSKQKERPPKQTLLFVFLVLFVSLQLTCRCRSGAGWSQSSFHCKPCRCRS